MTTYTDMIQNLDSKYSYTNYNNKPVKRMNTVWEITIMTNHKAICKKIYKTTDKSAEVEARKFVENYRAAITKRNETIRAKYERMNKEMLRYDPENAVDWLYDEDFIKEQQYEIKSIVINVTDREGNRRVITW